MNGQQREEQGRQPWAPPVVTRFAIDRTLFGSGSPGDGSTSGSASG